jgi:alkylated DNA repair protein alkB homolog 7
VHIDAHVDSVKFSGELVAGLSLMSDRWLQLSPSAESPLEADRPSFNVLLPRRSLYMLRGPLRYDYAHAILGKKQVEGRSDLAQQHIVDRRISLMFRDVHDNDMFVKIASKEN